MRPPLPDAELAPLLDAARAEPTAERLRDLIDRPDPAVQRLLAEPWARPWLERLLAEDPVLALVAPRAGADVWSAAPGPGEAATPAPQPAPEALFYAQSLLFALSHHPDTLAADRVAALFLHHPVAAVRLAACRTIERWGRVDHEPALRAGFADPDTAVRRRALRAVMARDPATAFDRLGAVALSAATDAERLRDLLAIVGRDADRRFAFERVGFRDADPRWLGLAAAHRKSRDRELRQDAEYALLGASKDAITAATRA